MRWRSSSAFGCQAVDLYEATLYAGTARTPSFPHLFFPDFTPLKTLPSTVTRNIIPNITKTGGSLECSYRPLALDSWGI